MVAIEIESDKENIRKYYDQKLNYRIQTHSFPGSDKNVSMETIDRSNLFQYFKKCYEGPFRCLHKFLETVQRC